MANTVEELFKKSNELLERNVRIPAVFSKLAERGYTPETEEQAQELFKVSEDISAALATGEIIPVPARELEQDGAMSKHASEAASQDFLHFAPECEINMDDVDEQIKTAAAVVALANVCDE